MDIEQIQQDFREDGFAVIRGYLSPTELAELRDRADGFIRAARNHKRYPGTRKRLDKDDPWFRRQLDSGRHVALIEQLLEGPLEPATAACFDRIPGDAAGIEPHIDAIGHGRPGATMWVALDQADRDNGCLYYVKGSHRTASPGKGKQAGFSPDTPGATAVEVAPGDAVIHSSLIVHWSGPNSTSRPRRAVSYFYWAAS
jgi:phytanoyl-CoA hydroxylase